MLSHVWHVITRVSYRKESVELVIEGFSAPESQNVLSPEGF